MSKKSHRRRHKSLFHRRTPPGAPPGTLVVDPEAPQPIIRIMAFGPDDFTETEIEDLQAIPPFLEKWPVTWVNVDGLGDVKTIRQIGQIFNLHPLALEDVVNVHQRPKVEPYPDQHFVVAREAHLNERLETEQMSFFLGKNFVISLQEFPGDSLDPVRDRIRKGIGRVRSAGPDFLLYSLLDAIVDSYFPVMESLGERLESLEDAIVSDPTPKTVSQIHEVKRNLLQLRRSVWPFREAVNSLYRDVTPLVTDDTRLYLRDLYDHTIQIIDLLEIHREVASGMVDVYLSSMSNRMNEIMKVLTIIATIFMPLSFVAGLYGMNFNTDISPWNMPELNKPFGYPMVLLLMAAVVALMLAYFRQKGFIGGGKKGKRASSEESRDYPDRGGAQSG